MTEKRFFVFRMKVLSMFTLHLALNLAKRKEEKKKEKKDFAACAIHTRFQNTDKLREKEIKKLTTECMKNEK